MNSELVVYLMLCWTIKLDSGTFVAKNNPLSSFLVLVRIGPIAFTSRLTRTSHLKFSFSVHCELVVLHIKPLARF